MSIEIIWLKQKKNIASKLKPSPEHKISEVEIIPDVIIESETKLESSFCKKSAFENYNPRFNSVVELRQEVFDIEEL